MFDVWSIMLWFHIVCPHEKLKNPLHTCIIASRKSLMELWRTGFMMTWWCQNNKLNLNVNVFRTWMFNLCQFFNCPKVSSSLPCVRFPCQRLNPMENMLLWSSAWNTIPTTVITQVWPQVRDFTLRAALVYLFLSVCCPVSSLSSNESHKGMILNHNYLYDKYSLVLFDVIRTHTLTH